MRSAPARRLAPRSPLPPVDQRLVSPGERFEILSGKVIAVPPSLEPHGDRHSKLQALLEAHAAEAYNVACDMLTRSDEVSDLAPDASVYPSARDPETGGRQLEELAFEVLGRQTRAQAASKADELLGRGVRRVFAIEVEQQRVLERRAGRWQVLRADSRIVDRALSVGLPVRALSEAGKVDDELARALLAKGNPVLEEHTRQTWKQGEARGVRRGKIEGLREGKVEGLREGKAQGLREGEVRGLRAAVEALCGAYKVKLTSARRAQLAGLDAAGLSALLLALGEARAWPPSRP